MNTLTAPPRKPWYREPWPWFLMSLPATAVVAGLTTVWIAFSNYDGLVVGDYYKAGLAINQTLARDDAAYALGLVASFRQEDHALSVTLTGKLANWPERLTLTLAHPTHQGFDQTVTLHHAGGGHYRAQLPVLHPGKWHAQLTDATSTWRLSGALHAPFDQVSTLTASTVHQPQGD
jgi:hypothetical protein